jgi:hypothetical protein
MLLTYFKRRKFLRKANALELTPLTQLQSETGADGLVTVFIPKFKNKRIASFVLPGTKSNFIRLKLDENGSKVWNAIDGIAKVGDISQLLKEKSTDGFPQAEERVAKFLLRIYQDRFITFKETEAIK